MHQRWKGVLSRLLIGSLTIPASLALGLTTAPAAHADLSDVKINEILPGASTGHDKIELYDADKSLSDGTGLTLNLSGTTLPLSATNAVFDVNGFATVDVRTDLGVNNGKVVKLYQGANQLDSIEYGTSLTADVPAPAADMSIARITDGTGSWVSNVSAATMGATNATLALSQPTAPTALAVDSTGLNPAHYINDASKGSVSVTGTVASDAVLGTLKGELVDAQLNPASFATSAIVGAGSVDATGIDAHGLADGAIKIRAYVETAAGVRSAWAPAAPVASDWKDVVAPTVAITTPASAVSTNATNYTITGTTTGTSVRLTAGETSVDATVTGGTFSGTVTLVNAANTDTANAFTATASDLAGNTASVVVSTITQDSTIPADVTGLSYQSAATGKVTLSWTNSASADVASYSIFTDNGTGTMSNTALASVAPGTGTTSFSTSVLANGTYMFGVVSVDQAGNMSAGQVVSGVGVNGPKIASSATAPGATADLTASVPFTFTPATGTSGNSTFTVTNNGTSLPSGSVPSGISFLGQFYEITDSQTPSATNPVLIKFYYTQAQLDAAHVSESQLQGIYYYDSTSKTWKLYTNTGVNTANVTVNGVAYAGYVYANADHFTPIAFGADTQAPVKPANLAATASDGQVSLSWNSVSDAVSYTIRWRPATSNDTVGYTTMTVNGSTTSAVATGLNNGWQYELGVAATDAVGNQSDFGVVVATPKAAGATTATTGSIGAGQLISASSSAVAASTTGTSSTSTSNESTLSNPSAAAGQTTQGSSNDAANNSANQNRALVIALILVIAAGAGAAGYYGYQWWAERPVPTTAPTQPTPPQPKAPTNGKKKPKPSSGRW